MVDTSAMTDMTDREAESFNGATTLQWWIRDWEEAVRRVKAWQDRAESAVDLVQQLRGAWCSEHCTFNEHLCDECVEKDCTGRQTQQWLTAGAGE